jgi:hypothetical protein
VVLKITHVAAAAGQTVVETSGGSWTTNATTAALTGYLRQLGTATAVKAGFEYRDITGLDTSERTGIWQETEVSTLTAVGSYSVSISGLKSGHTYEFRAVVKSGAQPGYGHEMILKER